MLLISDLHLSDKADDEYRWQIFEFINSYYEMTEDKNLIILGDLTDAKDHHSARLVNNITQDILNLRDRGMEIFILKGNHDYINPDLPFFEFLGEYQYVNYITWPKTWLIQGERCLFLPHTRNPIDEWETDKQVSRSRRKASLVFMHQSVIGSVASNGYEMTEGLRSHYFERFKGQVFSGDIHVPQKVGPVIYVGSPYSVRFNDHFKPRAISLAMFPPEKSFGGIAIPPCQLLMCEIQTGLPGRRTVDLHELEDLQKCEANPGDQIKVRVYLEDTTKWPTYKEDIEKECKDLQFDLRSLQLMRRQKLPLRKRKKAPVKEQLAAEIVKQFSRTHGLSSSIRSVGLKLVED